MLRSTINIGITPWTAGCPASRVALGACNLQGPSPVIWRNALSLPPLNHPHYEKKATNSTDVARCYAIWLRLANWDASSNLSSKNIRCRAAEGGVSRGSKIDVWLGSPLSYEGYEGGRCWNRTILRKVRNTKISLFSYYNITITQGKLFFRNLYYFKEEAREYIKIILGLTIVLFKVQLFNFARPPLKNWSDFNAARLRKAGTPQFQRNGIYRV